MFSDNINTSIREAAIIIRAGGVVAFPTETVYGLGANALDAKAAARVFEVKRRPHFDPLIVHIGYKDWIERLVTDIPPLAQKLIDKFWPGPLTLVLPKKKIVPDIITSGLPGVGVRMPANDIARQLIKLADVPIAAPSANLFGGVSPTTAEHVRESLGASADMIIDGGECKVGIESTVVSFMADTPILLRPGGVILEDIESAVGQVVIPKRGEYAGQSPGRSEQHYATNVPLIFVGSVGCINDISSEITDRYTPSSGSENTGKQYFLPNEQFGVNISCNDVNKIGLLALSPNDTGELPPHITNVEYLSKDGDLREAACNLFAAMRRLDASGVDMIVALPIPNTGIGRAINDRLHRASMR